MSEEPANSILTVTKKEAQSYSEIMVPVYQSIQYCIPHEQNQYFNLATCLSYAKNLLEVCVCFWNAYWQIFLTLDPTTAVSCDYWTSHYCIPKYKPVHI